MKKDKDLEMAMALMRSRERIQEKRCPECDDYREVEKVAENRYRCTECGTVFYTSY